MKISFLFPPCGTQGLRLSGLVASIYTEPSWPFPQFWDRVLCGPDWLWTYCVAEAGLALLILRSWGYRHAPCLGLLLVSSRHWNLPLCIMRLSCLSSVRLWACLYLLQFLTPCPIQIVFNGVDFDLCNSSSIILPFYGTFLIKEKKYVLMSSGQWHSICQIPNTGYWWLGEWERLWISSLPKSKHQTRWSLLSGSTKEQKHVVKGYEIPRNVWPTTNADLLGSRFSSE